LYASLCFQTKKSTKIKETEETNNYIFATGVQEKEIETTASQSPLKKTNASAFPHFLYVVDEVAFF